MSNYTLSDLATRMLKDAGLVGSEETPRADDLAWAEETCLSEIGMMNALGLPIWNGSDVSIPPEYLTTLSRRIALAVAPSYGLTDLASAQAAMAAAERSLTMLAAPRALAPLTLRSDDAKRDRRIYDFASGR